MSRGFREALLMYPAIALSRTIPCCISRIVQLLSETAQIHVGDEGAILWLKILCGLDALLDGWFC